MKKILFTFVLGAFVLAVPLTAHAQTPTRVKVPFPFVVSGALLPAGDYLVLPFDSASTDVLQFLNRDGKAEAVVATTQGSDVSSNAKATFDFERFGGEYFLSRINVPGEVAHEIPLQSRIIAQDLVKLAQNRTKPLTRGAAAGADPTGQ